MKKGSSKGRKNTFETVQQVDVPHGRNGKHRKIVSAILADLEGMAPSAALKVPLAALNDTKENVRAALSRESKKRKQAVTTAADGEYLYVWPTQLKGQPDR